MGTLFNTICVPPTNTHITKEMIEDELNAIALRHDGHACRCIYCQAEIRAKLNESHSATYEQ